MNNQTEEYREVFDEQERNYSTADSVFALIMFIFGYLNVSWVLFVPHSQGLGSFLTVLAFAVMSVVYMRLKKIRISVKSAVQLGVICVFAASFVLFANDFIKLLTLGYVWLSLVYWFFCTCGNHDEDGVGDMLIFDLAKSVFVMPFSCFGALFGGVKCFFKRSALGKKVGMAVLGIIIAILPTAVVTVLLINADGAFQNLTNKLFSGLFDDVPRNIWYFILGIPVAMYVFGLMYANTEHMKSDTMTPETNKLVMARARILPPLLTCAAATPVIIVYVLFFFSQMSYFLSAFSGIRPADVTYAEYARNGFFELCAVSVINLIIIIVAGALTKRENGKKSPAVKGYIVTLSAFTLGLIAIALSKMIMYIDAYGLTRLRVYTTWFMIVLAALFVMVIIRQFSAGFNLFRTFSVCFVALFAVLVFGDVDGLCARYNVYCYTSGKHMTVDIGMMYDLSDSAVKYVLPLTEDDNPIVAEQARMYVESKRDEYASREDTFANFNFTTYNAELAVNEDK